MESTKTFGQAASVRITILVDNQADLLARESDGVERFHDEQLIAEHGFAALVELPDQDTRILWDSGASTTTLVENMRRMNFDPATIDLLALSHGHWDHVGGVSEFLRAVDRRPQAKMFPAGTADKELASYAQSSPLRIIAHPAMFTEQWGFLPDGRRYGPIHPPRQGEWEGLGAQVIEDEGPHRLAEGCWTTGYVPRKSFEVSGRSATHRSRSGETFTPHDIEDDQAIILHVEGKGLVVLSGCAHAGIVNTVHHAQQISGVETIHAILGGFHLARTEEAEVDQTIDAIAAFDPDLISPTHCTGFGPMALFANRLPDAFVQCTVGTTFTF